MEDNLNLEELKGRLAKLGVHVSPNPIVASSGANLIQLAREGGGARRSLASEFTRHKPDVVELLDRCTKVEAGLQHASAVVNEAKGVVNELATPLTASPNPPPRSPSPQARAAGKKLGKGGSSSSSATKGKKAGLSTEPSGIAPRSPKPAASPPTPRPRPATAPHTPLSTVLAQYKEAETLWAQEKGKLRREAAAERKRASKLELELQRLQRLYEHRGLDLKAMRAALQGRDVQLQGLAAQVKELEGINTRVQEHAAERMGSVAAERDDLKALLMATLQRLESVEDVVHRADVSSAKMEEKVKVLEVERGRAVEAAARARAEAEELSESKKRLQWQSRLLEKMSEVQLNHNRRKSDAIKELLRAEEEQADHTDHTDQATTLPSTSAATSEAGDDLVAKYKARGLSPGRKLAF